MTMLRSRTRTMRLGGKGKAVPWLRPDITVKTPPLSPKYGSIWWDAWRHLGRSCKVRAAEPPSRRRMRYFSTALSFIGTLRY